MNELDNYLNDSNQHVLLTNSTAEEETNYTESLFESIRYENEYEQEFCTP